MKRLLNLIKHSSTESLRTAVSLHFIVNNMSYLICLLLSNTDKVRTIPERRNVRLILSNTFPVFGRGANGISPSSITVIGASASGHSFLQGKCSGASHLWIHTFCLIRFLSCCFRWNCPVCCFLRYPVGYRLLRTTGLQTLRHAHTYCSDSFKSSNELFISSISAVHPESA